MNAPLARSREAWRNRIAYRAIVVTSLAPDSRAALHAPLGIFNHRRMIAHRASNVQAVGCKEKRGNNRALHAQKDSTMTAMRFVERAQAGSSSRWRDLFRVSRAPPELSNPQRGRCRVIRAGPDFLTAKARCAHHAPKDFSSQPVDKHRASGAPSAGFNPMQNKLHVLSAALAISMMATRRANRVHKDVSNRSRDNHRANAVRPEHLLTTAKRVLRAPRVTSKSTADKRRARNAQLGL